MDSVIGRSADRPCTCACVMHSVLPRVFEETEAGCGSIAACRVVSRGPRTGNANPLLSPGPCWRPALRLYLADSHSPSSAGGGGVCGADNSQHHAGSHVQPQGHHGPIIAGCALRLEPQTRGAAQLGCLQRHEQLGGDRPRMAGERIREVKEEPERQLGRGTGADSLTRHPRPARHYTTGCFALQLVAQCQSIKRTAAGHWRKRGVGRNVAVSPPLSGDHHAP